MLPVPKDLSRLLGLLYDAAADPALWDLALANLANASGSQAAALLMRDQRRDPYTVSRIWGFDPNCVQTYNEHFAAVDVWAGKAKSIKMPEWICTSESLCPFSELSRTEYYNDFLKKGGFPHAIFSRFQPAHSLSIVFALYRTANCGEFQSSELDILRFITPHIQRAFNLHLTISNIKELSAGMAAALDMLPTGIALLGFDGKILHMNRLASAMFLRRDGLVATQNGLKAKSSVESARLDKLICEAIHTSIGKGLSSGGRLRVSRTGRAPLHVLISPVRNLPIDVPRSVCAVAFISDPEKSIRPAEDFLRVTYGLSRAECRVALLLSDGHAPRRIAEIIGVTDNTVRSQLKSIFSKTAVRRQSELVRLLLSNAGI